MTEAVWQEVRKKERNEGKREKRKEKLERRKGKKEETSELRKVR